MDDELLRKKARAAIQSGKLPAFRRPDRTWSGNGAGAPCAVCELPVRHHDLEFEIQFARRSPELDKFQMHLHCFAMWELERHGTRESGGAGAALSPSSRWRWPRSRSLWARVRSRYHGTPG